MLISYQDYHKVSTNGGIAMIKITLPDGHYYDEMLTTQGEQRPHQSMRAMVSRNTDQFSIRQKKQAEPFHRIGITLTSTAKMRKRKQLIPL